MIQFNIFILFFCLGVIIAVPIKSSIGRVRRDGESALNTTSEANGCIFDENEYKAGQEVPSLGPCETCVCEAPDVVCSMVKCQPNSGCKIIQQSGQCCPEYKCDCEYNDRVYNNGERLDNPDDPCKVCYCKGGEIMCTSVTCYERDDCQPHFSPGQCCPKYDHCPVESSKGSNNSIRSVNASVYSPKREMQPWPLTKSSNTQSSITSEESNGPQNNIFPQTIKIVEILPTTPASISKLGEVSVIPRVKTNDDENKEEFVKSEDISKTTDESEITQSTSTESYESSTIITSSTSEIDHLMDTTPQTEENDEKQLVKAIPERSVSTINPLSEQISITADPQPDSHKIATIVPGDYSSIGTLSNSENSTTFDSTTEVEGSGYELLQGGIYEELSKEVPMYTTENIIYTAQLSSNQTSKEETTGESQEISSYEAYTTTEHISSIEDSSSLSESLESYINNDTSVEMLLHSNNSSSELKGELTSNVANDTENSSSENISSEEKSVEDKENYNENNSSNFEITTNGSALNNTEYLPSTENHYSDKQQSISLEVSSEDAADEFSTEPFSTENALVTSTESSLGTSAASLLSTDDSEYSTTDELSTVSSESNTLAEGATELTNIINNRSKGFLGENKKSARLTHGKFDQVSNDSQVSSSLTFPSILKVQSLGADQFSTQTESSAMENTTTMARIGIYHPTKTNESAGYLTIVDEKLNTSSGNEKLFSTHILLTPHDLKKLAELLIQEKIKPASIQKISKGAIQNQNDDNSRNISTENNSQSTTGRTSEDLPSYYDSSSDSVGVGTPEEYHKNEETLSSIEFMQISNQKEYLSEDPNTSRQIRIPENFSPEFSTLLDDRDLRILENFFRKNIGLH